MSIGDKWSKNRESVEGEISGARIGSLLKER